MKCAYFDTIAGISGDMTLGAFVSAGVSLDVLSEELRKLNLPGFELSASHVERNAIVATKVEVIVSADERHHRHLKDIHAIIDQSALGPTVKKTAKAIFHEVAAAEARVHQKGLEDIHFHEVGALDSIVDIVGTAICLERLNISEVYSSPVKLGSGDFVPTQHGSMPIPTPATIEILKGYPTLLTDIASELTTPTGAAIIKALSRGTLSTERLVIEHIGYGAGSKEMPEIPNLLRIMVGHLDEHIETDSVVSVETNIDNMNPEIYPFLIERLLESGAHDAYLVPILMKKGRPGTMVSVLVREEELEKMLDVLFRETTTLGVRIHRVDRRKLVRSSKEVSTSFGQVRIKVIQHGTRSRYVAEFEECKRIALERNVPLKDVYAILEKELNP